MLHNFFKHWLAALLVLGIVWGVVADQMHRLHRDPFVFGQSQRGVFPVLDQVDIPLEQLANAQVTATSPVAFEVSDEKMTHQEVARRVRPIRPVRIGRKRCRHYAASAERLFDDRG